MAQSARRKAPRRAAPGRRARAPRPTTTRVVLDRGERRLLRRVCERYRAQIPSYLLSGSAELALLERLLRKL